MKTTNGKTRAIGIRISHETVARVEVLKKKLVDARLALKEPKWSDIVTNALQLWLADVEPRCVGKKK
jgi:hypothetical protein